MKFTRRFQEFIYSLSTNDKYSEFDSRKSFNRINKPDSETNLLYSHHNQSTNDFIGGDYDEISKGSFEGVHEVRLAWRHIKNWLSKHSPDILNSLQDKCTTNDLNDFQKDLNIRIPNCLVEFFKLTDGQSNYGVDNHSVGLIFGLKLMSLDEIMIETENWRKISKVFNNEMMQMKQTSKLNELTRLPLSHSNNITQFKRKLSENDNFSSSTELIGSNSSRSSSVSSSDHFSAMSTSPVNHIPKQRSIPPGAIQETFSHPMWIPIITDEVGNYIGVDLSPPLKGSGKWGQVILFGREFDSKFKIANNWGDFLLIFANDLEIGNWDIKAANKNNYGDLMIGNEGELVFVDKDSTIEIPYLEVLKRRCIKQWIQSLDQQEEEQSNEIKQLVNELKNPISEILSFKSLSSIDNFINNNLSIIDSLNKPINSSNRTSNSPIIKSPLSNELTNNLQNESDTPNIHRKDSNGVGNISSKNS